GGEGARVLVGAGLVADRVEEVDAEAGTAGEAGEVGGSLDRNQGDVRLRHLEREAADAAAGAQDLALRAGALREDADAGAGAQGLDRLRQGVFVPLATLDRDLTHAVEDRGETAHLPELRFG